MISVRFMGDGSAWRQFLRDQPTRRAAPPEGCAGRRGVLGRVECRVGRTRRSGRLEERRDNVGPSTAGGRDLWGRGKGLPSICRACGKTASPPPTPWLRLGLPVEVGRYSGVGGHGN